MEAYWFSKAMDRKRDYANTAYDADSRLGRSSPSAHKDRKALSLFDSRIRYGSCDLRYRRVWREGREGLARDGQYRGCLDEERDPIFGYDTGWPGVRECGWKRRRPNLLDPSILSHTIGNPDTSVAMLPASAFAFIAPAAERQFRLEYVSARRIKT